MSDDGPVRVGELLPTSQGELKQLSLHALPDYTISRRSREVWKKFVEWYGPDNMMKIGLIPPRDYCASIDSIPTRGVMGRALSDVRSKHVTFPPRFPEFDAIVARLTKPLIPREGPPAHDLLTQYVLRRKALTRQQLRGAWTFLFRRGPDGERETTGVHVPDCWETGAAGFRVMVEDMQLSTDEVM